MFGPIWMWRFLMKAVKLLTFKNKHSGGGGGHKSSSVWHIIPDVIHTVAGFLF